MKPARKSSSRQISLRGEGGQIIVEYLLLLVAGVGIAMLITTMMVSRNPENPGFLIQKWMSIITTIGHDTADDVSSTNPN